MVSENQQHAPRVHPRADDYPEDALSRPPRGRKAGDADAFQPGSPAIEHATAAAHVAVDKAGVAAEHAAGWIAEHGAGASNKSGRFFDRMRKLIALHPLSSVAIALFAGLILGRI
jgi:hypothetical protein